MHVEHKHATVVVVPKPGLPPEDYQRLAYCLSLALKELTATEQCGCGSSAIDDLIAGELPKSLVLNVMTFYRELKKTFKVPIVSLAPSEATAAAKRALDDNPFAELCDVPAVFIRVERGIDESDEAVLARVLAMLPRELVSEVRALHR